MPLQCGTWKNRFLAVTGPIRTGSNRMSYLGSRTSLAPLRPGSAPARAGAGGRYHSPRPGGTASRFPREPCRMTSPPRAEFHLMKASCTVRRRDPTLPQRRTHGAHHDRKPDIRHGGDPGAVHDRRHPGKRKARQAARPVHHLVQLEHHAPDLRHRGARAGGLQAAVRGQRPGDPAGQPARRAVHGASLRAGAAAGRAADDPEPRPVRHGRRGAGHRDRRVHVRRLLRLEPDPRRAVDQPARPRRQHRLGHRHLRRGQPAHHRGRLRPIHAVNRWATILFGGVMLLALGVIVARGLPATFLSEGSFTWSGFIGAAATTGILWQIAYAPYVSDYSRYMPAGESVRATFWFSYAGVVLGTVLPMILGVVVGLASANPDQISAIDHLTSGAGWLIMLVFALGIIDTNAINLYGGMLCSITVGQTFRHRWLPRARTRAVVSVLIVAVALVGALAYQSTFLTSYVNFILFLLYVLIPWTAINLVDFYLIRHGQYHVPSFFEPSGGVYGRVNWATLIVYLIGVGIQIPFVNTTLFEGPVARSLGGTDLSWLVGLAVILPLYYMVARARVAREAKVPVRAGSVSA